MTTNNLEVFMRRLLSLLTLLSFSTASYALEVEYFDFTNSKTYALTDDALLDNSLVNNKYPWMFTAAYDYVKVPLSVSTDDERTDEIVKSLQGIHLGGGVRIFESLFIGAKTYLARIDTDEEEGFYWGDSVIEAKWRFYQNSNTAIALAPAIYLPSGTQTFTTDNRKVGEYLGLNLERNFEWVQISLMAGYANKPGATFNFGPGFTNIDYKQSIYTAFGSILPFNQYWAMNVEGYRYNQLKGNQHPNEFYVGLRNQTTASLSTFFGVSLGGIIDDTANDYRLSLGIKFTPFEEKVVEKIVEKPQPVAPVKKITKREEGLKKEKALYGQLVGFESIYFGNGSSKVDKFSKEVIQKFHNVVTKFKTQYTIVLEGFASKVGNPENNMKLSKNRIRETEAYLMSLGVKSGSIVEVAYGDSAADLTISEALNRKVMLRIYKK